MKNIQLAGVDGEQVIGVVYERVAIGTWTRHPDDELPWRYELDDGKPFPLGAAVSVEAAEQAILRHRPEG